MNISTRGSLVAVVLLSWGVLAQSASEMGKSYPDGHGGQVYFPLGDISFADEVVSFQKGDPAAAPRDSDPANSLGIPDYDDVADTGYVTLGCEGTLVLRFVDNALVDVEGPDLYVFEIGPAVEPTALAVSADGREWIEIGEISGGRAEVDIRPYTRPGEAFYYVRLTDLKTGCDGQWPGADIDAVGAIGSGLKFNLRSAVLFDFDQWKLKPEAQQELRKMAEEIRQHRVSRILIEGHTDNVGSQAYNQQLSEKRAQAVKTFLSTLPGFARLDIVTRGYGETRPIASNATEEGRERNRRVEVVVFVR